MKLINNKKKKMIQMKNWIKNINMLRKKINKVGIEKKINYRTMKIMITLVKAKC